MKVEKKSQKPFDGKVPVKGTDTGSERGLSQVIQGKVVRTWIAVKNVNQLQKTMTVERRLRESIMFISVGG